MPNGLKNNTTGISRPAETQSILRKFGVVGKCAGYVVAGVFTTSFVLPAVAGTISDLFVCVEENVSLSDLTDHFKQRDWDAAKPKASHVLRQVMFLGNVDAADPSKWEATANLAASLSADAAQINQAVFATATTAVSIEMTSQGHIACLIVSNEILEDQFQAKFPNLNPRDYSGRKFGQLVDSNLQVSATFLSADAVALAQLAGGRRTTATILNKTASLKEE